MDEFRRPPVNRVGGDRPVRPVPAQPQRPLNPQAVPQAPGVPAPQQPAPTAPQPLETPEGLSKPPKKKSKKKVFIWSGVGVLLAAIIAFFGVLVWYDIQLSPVDASNKDKSVVTIEAGSSPSDIASTLKEEGVIRNVDAFLWFTRLEKVQNNLQAGSYRLSPSESTPEIVNHLVNGTVDTFNVTFLPGATLSDNRKVLISAGYSEEDVDAALAKSYDSPLFAGKPASADLEGYIYGETYTFGTNTSVEQILEHTFEEFYSVVKENDLEAKYAAQNRTLYQGITLASIVQREASPKGDDMPQIAQVFSSRLAQGMPLGSDVTYQYIADKTGVPRDTNLDSPYNTRRYAGLPPGPIASPGEKALVAVANPAEGNYLYFLSGDDDITYYGRTLQEHEANIRNHCQKKCQII